MIPFIVHLLGGFLLGQTGRGVGGAVLGAASRGFRHGITPAAIIFAAWEQLAPLIEEELTTLLVAGVAYLVSISLSKFSDALREAREAHRGR